jgi:DNA-binding GntR family transcriptional regulator
MSGSRRRPRPSLYEEIAEIICDRIAEGGLPAGSFIDEPALALELEVSRTPVREALKVLVFEGLVDIFPNQGSYVAKITAEDARDPIELLAQLEGFAGELTCQRSSDEMLKSLTRTHQDMIEAYQKGDKPTYFKLNQRIQTTSWQPRAISTWSTRVDAVPAGCGGSDTSAIFSRPHGNDRSSITRQ